MNEDDIERFEERELELYREYRDVLPMFAYVIETEYRFYLANKVDIQHLDGGWVRVELEGRMGLGHVPAGALRLLGPGGHAPRRERRGSDPIRPRSPTRRSPSALARGLRGVRQGLARLADRSPRPVGPIHRDAFDGPGTVGRSSVLGSTGTIVHVAAAALGLSAILASSAVSFQVVKYAGAAYLIWLGVKALRERHQEASEGRDRERSLGRIYAQGVVVNVLNPKTALFFLAFLPQFVDVGEPVTPQVLVLGLVHPPRVRVGRELRARVRAGRADARGAAAGAARRWLPGLTLIGLGVAAAVTGRRPATG